MTLTSFLHDQRPTAARVLGLSIACALASTRTAAADDAPFTIGSQPAWLFLGGVTTGGTVALGGRGALVGGELSLARLRDAQFAGVYADAYYDWGAHGTYVTGGFEVGRRFFGLDGGVAVRFVDGDGSVGETARLSAGIGVVSAYVRYVHFESGMDRNILQVGLVLKLPLWTSGVK